MQGRVYGSTEVTVDEVAQRDAVVRLRHDLAGVDVLRTSPRERCRWLAQRVAAVTGAQVVVDDRLAELDFGSWEGRLWSEVPRAEIDAWSQEFLDFRPGGAESTRELLTRVSQALRAERRENADAVWITHAGVIRALHLLLAGVDRPTAAQWPTKAVPFATCMWLRIQQHTASSPVGPADARR